MAFQFQCPNGHLLEADESQSGDQCHCPHCDVLLIIPESPHNAALGGSAQAWNAGDNAPAAATPFNLFAASAPQWLHIPCPKGHVLDVPFEMIGQEVLCPHCQAQFLLHERDSVEYRRRKEAEQELREIRAGRIWMNWAIAFAVIVILGLVAMIVRSYLR